MINNTEKTKNFINGSGSLFISDWSRTYKIVSLGFFISFQLNLKGTSIKKG